MISIREKDLNIGHLSTVYHTNFILMENKEFKRIHDRNINWILFGTGPEMVRAFKDKSLELGYMGLPPAIIGMDIGVPIKCIAGGHVEGTIMIAGKDYKQLKDLKYNLFDVLAQFRGKSIGVTSKGSIHDVILNYYLQKYNLLNEIKVKRFEQAEFIALNMRKGLIEAGVGTPALAVFASTIMECYSIIEAKDLWPNNPSYGVFTHERLIKNDPNLILEFLVHHKNAAKLLRDSPVIAAEKIVKKFDLINQKYTESVLKISPKYCIALSKRYVKATMKFMEALLHLGYIKKKFKIKDIFDFRFVKKIHPEQDHYSIE